MSKAIFVVFLVSTFVFVCDSAKINTPRVLLPWFENLNVNFTFEIIEGGCYTWSLSRDDIIDLEPIYEDTWAHCSRAARVSVSKTCVPPGSVIIMAEEINTGEILRGDVDIDKIGALKVMSTTWKLYLEEAPEAFEVIAYDEQGNTFSTLEGIKFTWSIENIGSTEGDDLLVSLVRWSNTDYEAPRGVAELEALGVHSHSALLYGQALGEARVTVCLDHICTHFNLRVVASVVLTPATASIAPGDTLKYRVVSARAGRLTIQDVSDSLYYLKVPETDIALLEDSISLVRGTETGTTIVQLMSGSTEVATATLNVAAPHSIRVTLRPPSLLIRGETFLIHCIVLDRDGHALTAGSELLIRLSVEGDANVDLLSSTENGTLTDAVAANSGGFTVTAKLHSIAGKLLSSKVEGQVSAAVVDPLEIVPSELFVAWTGNIQEIPLKHIGGGNEDVVWSESETAQGALSLAPDGVVAIKGEGNVGVKVHLKKYPHVKATGRVWSAPHEMIHVSTSGIARVGRPHHLHVVLTAAHPTTGELFNFHRCNCASFAVSLLEGPEPHNTTAATWVEPADGACCVLEVVYSSRGVSTVRVSRGRAGDSARVAVRAAPALLWPQHAVALVGASLPVLAVGEELVPISSESRTAELTPRDGPPPRRYPDVQLFTFKCKRKGEARVEVTSHADEEPESVTLEASCAPHVSRVRLEPPATPGNCTAGAKIWLRPGQEVSIKTTLLDAIGRELLDERGPKVSWDIEPYHPGIVYRAKDRLFVEMHPEYAPVPVPHTYYQLVLTDEKAIGWTGSFKASIPDATASIQAKVVAPLRCDPLKVNVAWEGETLNNLVTITGGSGRYSVESPKGVTATVDSDALTLSVPGPGSYDLLVMDLCVHGEKQHVEVYIEEVLSVEVSTSRAVGVGACVPISALVKGVSHRYLSTSGAAEWRTSGDVTVREGRLCGLREGSGRVRALLAGVWSAELEVVVFPPLQIIPSVARVPPGARLQLRHAGGPPPHLASLHYAPLTGLSLVEVTASGSVNGVSMGTARIKLVALDIENIELASAESYVEVIPISGLRVRSATQTLLVGSPSPVWIEAGGLSPSSLAALQPPPRVTFTLRDPAQARLYTTHADDMLERSVAEGLSVRVVPLKPGVITIDVRVRNMGQVAETRSWDSTIEILGISDIRTAIEGQNVEMSSGDRIALVVGSTIRMKSLPRGSWKAYEDGAFELTPNGELKGQRPGHGVAVAHHKDERNNIYRETAIHVEVCVPHYCTAEPARDGGSAIRVVMRNSLGRELLAPHGNVSVSPLPAESIQGTEVVVSGVGASGAFLTFQATASGVTVADEVWVAADSRDDRVAATGGWGVCLEGVGWRAPAGVSIATGSGVSLAVLSRDTPGEHTLRQDRAGNSRTIQQLPIQKLEFLAGEWPSSFVPLSITALGLTGGPLLCTEEQRYALDGVQVELPFICRTKTPHTAEPVINIMNDQIGCKIIPATPVIDASEVELCAEWGVFRACTKALLLPPVHVSQSKVSVLSPPALFTVSGHPHALKLTKVVPSPGLKLDSATKPGEITITVTNEASTCGLGWVTVYSKLTNQEIRVEVERDCDVACGTLLGALISLIMPYMSTILTIAAVTAAYLYIQSRPQRKAQIRLPTEPVETVPGVVPQESNPLNRSRTWSRSPYASQGPSVPVYGDASVLPDNSFSPSSRTHSSPYASQGPSVPVYGDASVLPDNSFSPSSRTHSRFL